MNPEDVLLCPVFRSAQRTPEAEALVFGDRRWTWAALNREVAKFAAWLSARGLGEGDRVTLLGANRPEFVFLLHAVARLGATLVPLNARLTEAELEPLRTRARAKLHLVLDEAIDAGEVQGAEAAPTLRSSAPRAILFTSGTTGVPKGAVLSVGQLHAAALGSAERLGSREGDRWLGTLPLFHVGGLSMAVRCAVSGCTLVLHERFDAEAAARSFDAEAITHASFVPTTLARVLDARRGAAFPETVRAVLIGGGPVTRELLERARAHRLPVLQTYGLTEACSQVTTERPEEADAASAGVPLSHLELRITDEAGQALGAGEEGEIEVRGGSVTSGYFDDAEATRLAFRDGWFRTRDLGVLDSRGRLTVLSRRADLILRGGENVYPAEIERVLEQHPSVIEAAVISEDHPDWGQVPIAAVSLREDVTPERLIAFCRERLARFKVPERVEVVEALPRNAMGKIDRARLRALLTDTTVFRL